MFHCFRLACCLCLALVVAPLSAMSEPLRVVVSVLPLQTFVEKVGADHVSVVTLVPPGQSPATYAPSSQQIRQLADADLFVRVGVPYEAAWMERIRATSRSLAVIDSRDGIDLKPLTGHAKHDVELGNALDPHIWTSPRLAGRMIATIRDGLQRLDPAHARDYAANHQAFAAELDELDRDIRLSLGQRTQRYFMTFHPAWGYFAETYGLTQLAVEHDGKLPRARQLADLTELAKRHGIDTVFVQPQFDAHLARRFARTIGAEVVTVDPLAADYCTSLRRFADLLAGGSES